MDQPIGIKLFETTKKIKKTLDEKATSLGIPCGYIRVLMELYKSINTDIYQSDIVDSIKFKKSTISVTLSNMELDKLIIRIKDNEDNRKTLIKLTDKGIKYCNKINKVFDDVENGIVNKLGNENINNLDLCLSLINLALDEMGDD